MPQQPRSQATADDTPGLGDLPTSEPCVAFMRALARWMARNDLRERARRDPDARRRALAAARIRAIDHDDTNLEIDT